MALPAVVFLARRRIWLALKVAAVMLIAVNLVRFGLEHNEFWAFYLSALGLLVLAVMIVRSTARDRLQAAGSTIREGLATWE